MNNGIGWAIKELQDGRRVRRKVFDVNVILAMGRRAKQKIYMRLRDGKAVEWRVVQSDILAMDWESAE